MLLSVGVLEVPWVLDLARYRLAAVWESIRSGFGLTTLSSSGVPATLTIVLGLVIYGCVQVCKCAQAMKRLGLSG